jgi:hypothetical protein
MKRLAFSLKHSLFIVILCLAALQYSCEEDNYKREIEFGAIIDYDGNSYSTKQLGT